MTTPPGQSFFAIVILLLWAAKAVALDGTKLPKGLLQPCDRQKEKFAQLARTVTNRTAAQCATAIEKAKETCVKQPDAKGLDKADGGSGLRGTSETQRQGLEIARKKFVEQAKICTESRTSVGQSCKESFEALGEARENNSTERMKFEQQFRTNYRDFAGKMESDLYAATARYRAVEDELRRDQQNAKEAGGQAEAALAEAVYCNEGYIKIYQDAEAEAAAAAARAAVGPDDLIATGAAVPPAGGSDPGANSARDAVASTAVQKGLTETQRKAAEAGASLFGTTAGGLARTVTPVMALKAAADGDRVGAVLGAGQSVAEVLGPARWAAATGGVGAFLGVVLSPSPISSCQGYYSNPVSAYNAGCGYYTPQSINSTITILESK